MCVYVYFQGKSKQRSRARSPRGKDRKSESKLNSSNAPENQSGKSILKHEVQPGMLRIMPKANSSSPLTNSPGESVKVMKKANSAPGTDVKLAHQKVESMKESGSRGKSRGNGGGNRGGRGEGRGGGRGGRGGSGKSDVKGERGSTNGRGEKGVLYTLL